VKHRIVNLFFAVLVPTEPHLPMVLPFVLMLVAIAVMPLFHPHWWEHHHPKVAAMLAAITVIYYVLVRHESMRMVHVAHEYLSFIALIGSLFVVSGGIHIGIKGEAKPWFNAAFLLLGAFLANIIGTTGASMLLIRPWIRMNKYRITAYHIVFFIFIVSNVGGSLTPIGDPPLFLGYLKGVPFWWVLEKCWLPWSVCISLLLGIFYCFDRINFRKAPQAIRTAETADRSFSIIGLRNIGFLALILAGVFVKKPIGLSETLMIVAALGSWFATPKQIHEQNDFNFQPIREVAWLFAGIFATMVPALDYLEIHASELGLDSALKFFWLTGSLSACLDNAPTYLTFLAAAMGRHHLQINDPAHVLSFVDHHAQELLAISLGAVFFGAMTYIGNGPNFMVRAIAQHAHVKTPGFFSYAFKYAFPILLPIFGIISLLLFAQ
jgi:Na+/H+ antiporter NhaD/arsenite permease-like protein